MPGVRWRCQLNQNSGKAKVEPVTIKDKLFGLLFAAIFIGLCAAIWLKPDLVSNNEAAISESCGKVTTQVLEVLWSGPVGILAGLVGLFIGWGAITKKLGTLPGQE